eukprot:8063538-Pyramimonas_sp.AAC.1
MSTTCWLGAAAVPPGPPAGAPPKRRLGWRLRSGRGGPPAVAAGAHAGRWSKSAIPCSRSESLS